MPAWLIVFAAFAVGAGAVVGIVALVVHLPSYLSRRRIEQRMRGEDVALAPREGPTSVVKLEQSGLLPALERVLARNARGGALSALIAQSGTCVSASAVVLAACACAGVLGAVTALLMPAIWSAVLGAVIGFAVPFVVLRHRRTRRMHRFEDQFPEALDLLSRALRAGHAFTTAMGMVASEAPTPIGPEFRTTFDEQNFGLPLAEALNNLAGRVPLLDVKFFVTAVLIQRDTGGNLSEILDNLSYVVRERFKVLRQVRVHTAHGRFTGYVLLALPASLAVVLGVINPEHMNLLFTEHMGHVMLTIAVVLQIIGFIWIKRVIKIEV